MNALPEQRSPAFRARLTAAATVLAAAVLLALRKPWALHTPQLWAEDGAVHLHDVDLWGWHALLMPYRGYLHVLPKLIAWIAEHMADVAHWPGIYNWSAFAFTLVVAARMLSPRLDLPGKPWLALAVVLVPNSGEVFLTITNLHWIADLLLIQQWLLARPTSAAQRAGDYLLIGLAGLSDPSALIFLPPFAYRAWRERNADSFVELALVVACAGVQFYFLRGAGLRADGDMPPFHLYAFLQVVGTRLIVWPFFGRHLANLAPAWVDGIVAPLLLVAILAWAARPDERRAQRLRIVAAWLLIGLACVYRIRPDGWPQKWQGPLNDLEFEEPYFFAARVLLLWLLIVEFAAAQPSIRWVARVACLAAVLLEIPYYHLDAPDDLHWAERCDPIRRGEKAEIPILPDWTLHYPGRPPTSR